MPARKPPALAALAAAIGPIGLGLVAVLVLSDVVLDDDQAALRIADGGLALLVLIALAGQILFRHRWRRHPGSDADLHD